MTLEDFVSGRYMSQVTPIQLGVEVDLLQEGDKIAKLDLVGKGVDYSEKTIQKWNRNQGIPAALKNHETFYDFLESSMNRIKEHYSALQGQSQIADKELDLGHDYLGLLVAREIMDYGLNEMQRIHKLSYDLPNKKKLEQMMTLNSTIRGKIQEIIEQVEGIEKYTSNLKLPPVVRGLEPPATPQSP